MWKIEGHVSRERRWGLDGVSLESVSAFSHDPIESSPNLYAYCDNNPLIYVDPFGLTACHIKLSIGDTLSSHKGLKAWLERNTGKGANDKNDKGDKKVLPPFIGVIGCGTYGPGGDNGGDNTIPKLPPIPPDQQIPGLQVPDIIEGDNMFDTIVNCAGSSARRRQATLRQWQMRQRYHKRRLHEGRKRLPEYRNCSLRR